MPKTHFGTYDSTAIETSRRARIACALIFLVAILLLLMVIIFPIGNGANATEIYLRNISTVAALFIMSIFFGKYSKLHREGNCRGALKFSSILLFIASLVKVGISVKYLVVHIKVGNMVGMYYVGEIVVWTAVALFAICYFSRMVSLSFTKTEEQLESEDDDNQA